MAFAEQQISTWVPRRLLAELHLPCVLLLLVRWQLTQGLLYLRDLIANVLCSFSKPYAGSHAGGGREARRTSHSAAG